MAAAGLERSYYIADELNKMHIRLALETPSHPVAGGSSNEGQITSAERV
jgi:hypothetical protein